MFLVGSLQVVMAELRVSAPLAFEETDDDWNDFSDSKQTESSQKNSEHMDNCNGEEILSIDGFLEREKSGSLEDLVKTFDRKLSNCFGDYEDSVSNIAPVQIRSQDDIINNCQ